MKVLNYLALVLVGSLLLFSCGGKKSKETKQEELVKIDEMVLPQDFLDQVEKYSLTPDSMLSAIELNAKINAYEIIKKGVKLEDGKLVNYTTKGQFEDKGLPKYWYYLIQQNVDQLNAEAAKNDSINLTEIYNLMMQNLDSGINANFKYWY